MTITSRFDWSESYRSPNGHHSATRIANLFLGRPYGRIHVVFRAGVNPTGTLAVSFIVLMSTTETLFDCSFATYAVLLSGVTVSQLAPFPLRSAPPNSFKSGRE